MDITYKGLKVPPTLRVSVAVGRDFGDSPVVTITNPRNLPPATAQKTGAGQYDIVFSASCVGETVSLTLSPHARNIFSGMFSGFLALFTFTFWLGMLPGRGFWSNLSWQRFVARSLMFSGMLFFGLVALELGGVSFHKKALRWLNTMDMVADAVDKIKDITGLDNTDPFFQSVAADQFYMRTGTKLQDAYLMTSVTEDGESYRMLIGKNFFGANELDEAQATCANDVGGEVPTLKDFYLLMKNESLASQLNFPFAEWTTYPRGVISDDYMLWLLPLNVKTYENALASVNTGTAESLKDMAENYNIDSSGLTDDEFKSLLLNAIKGELRLPRATETESNNGQTIFYLDENHQANFRCVRKLPMLTDE